MAKSDTIAKKGILTLLKRTVSGFAACEEVDIQSTYQLSNKRIKIHLNRYPIQINLTADSDPLHLYPEQLLGSDTKNGSAESYLLFDPKKYYNRISGFIRLGDGDHVNLGGDSYPDSDFLPRSGDIPPRLNIVNKEGCLIFKVHPAKAGTCIAPLVKDKQIQKIVNWRMKKLQRLRGIFGGPITPLPPKQALSLLREVNGVLAQEAYRAEDSSGRPGGVVAFPDDLDIILVGDLHAKPDNLLVALSQNSFLEELEQERACLVILGDAVHPEGDVPLDEMDSSILMMDLIFKLKLRFPRQVFYIRGNHDSFSDEIAKGGVPQGLLWSKALLKTRGKEYRKEMENFYQQLAYVAYSSHFIACHAAPPTSSPSLEQLVNMRDNGKLIREVINNRMRRPNRPSGYTKGDVKRFRKCLKVAKRAPVIVGHTPLSVNDTLWQNVGEIENHHIVYTSDSRWVGLMAQVSDQFYPFRYPAEPVIPIINALPD